MRTDWFTGSNPPVREGPYERKYPIGKAELIRYSYWDGKRWYVAGHTPEIAEAMYKDDEVAPRQRLSWRGLKEEA